MSNIGPLTTAFTGPSDCSILSVQIVSQTSTYLNYAGSVWPTPLRCFPSGYPFANSARFSNFYSPGICPSSWTAFGITSNFPDPSETTAICCPPGFTATLTKSIYATYFPCFTTNLKTAPVTAYVISGDIDIASKPYGSNSAGLITSTALIPEQRGWAVFGIQIRYRAADFDPNAPHSSSTSTASTGLTSAIPSPTSTPQPSATDTNTDNGALSTGAKIGIGVGVPLVVIIIVAILAFVCIRRRRRRRLANELNEGNGGQGTSELYGNAIVESGGAAKVELDATTPQAELDGTAVGSPGSTQFTSPRSISLDGTVSAKESPRPAIARKPLPPTYEAAISSQDHPPMSELIPPQTDRRTSEERAESLYREQRLEEIIAERERLELEEDDLRRRMARGGETRSDAG